MTLEQRQQWQAEVERRTGLAKVAYFSLIETLKQQGMTLEITDEFGNVVELPLVKDWYLKFRIFTK